MQEYMAVPAWAVEPLPQSVDFAHGALIEPLQAAVHGVSLAPLKPGWPVALVGAGIIGLSVLQVARAAGAGNIYVADPLHHNRELARTMGATATACSAAELLDLLPDLASQPRVVFECSGHPVALGECMELCRPGGVVVIIGVPHPDIIQFDTRPPRRKELHFVFSRRYKRETLKESVHLVAKNAVDLSAYPVQTFPLDQAPAAMQAAHARPKGVLRVVVLMN
jgi:L-iditol 2-dehydrogenase